MNHLSPSPTLAGFASWLAESADSLTEAAAKASTAGDPARGRQIYSLAQFLRCIGPACLAFAAGQQTALGTEASAAAPPPPPVEPAFREQASESLSRFHRE